MCLQKSMHHIANTAQRREKPFCPIPLQPKLPFLKDPTLEPNYLCIGLLEKVIQLISHLSSFKQLHIQMPTKHDYKAEEGTLACSLYPNYKHNHFEMKSKHFSKELNHPFPIRNSKFHHYRQISLCTVGLQRS